MTRKKDILVKIEKIDWDKLERPKPLDELLEAIDEAFEVEVFYDRGRKIGKFKLRDLKIKLL